MAYDPKETLTLAPSDQELARRWKAVRTRMEAEKIDVLIMQNSNQWLGGYIQWFADVPARNGYPVTVIFPLKEEMTTITCGGKPPFDFGPPAWTMRGVKNRLVAPYFPSMYYSNEYDAELAVQALQAWKDGTIGLVNTATMGGMFLEYLHKKLPNTKFVDATELVDRIKAIKSEEEIGFLMKTIALQDEAMAYARTVIKPGRKDFEIVADVVHKCVLLGSEEQLVIGGSAPFGIPNPPLKRHYQNRTVREGDQFTLMIEVNGPGGMYGEAGRCFFVGEVPSQLHDANELCKEAQAFTVKMLKPGADPKDIWDAYNEFLKSKGQLPESRLYAHGQGYDLVERPAIRDDEPMKLAANMNITIHPTITDGKIWVSVWDNWLITEKGPSERLHKTPQQIFSV
ncbi:MAG TPA: M24 family metallopeptidase [Syntrophorhabdales bacterium]|nr:M24 family metallopeptidase [Syntrophorhabdales bacterium]